MLKTYLSDLSPKRLFLIDSIGAILSAIFLGVVLVRFESTFGMPLNILYKLALAAVVFAAYSASCHFFLPTNWRPFLKAIALVNLTYSCLTLGLVIHFYAKLTALGLLYFAGELALVITLARIEWRTAVQN